MYLCGGVQTGATSVHLNTLLGTGMLLMPGRGGSGAADPSKGSVPGRGDSVSFALHVPRAVLSLCPSCEGIPGQPGAQVPMPSLRVCA